eukprot:CAMPEP_0197517612 /NCGR_PEP_ID=MMETSP1318-20131121/2653_1 /TAXON_ID=552666 /ORGANISM="Partenskyella glossopodia, Strain RCC365" /LENGTH=153 /DNA_ID=CAMNT_0043067317 /DNA_START=203 /DNA_END=660 /DNA_ORIENTATION=-
MRCGACKGRIRIITNPKDCKYDIVQGIRMGVNKDLHEIYRKVDKDREKIRSNPFYALDKKRHVTMDSNYFLNDISITSVRNGDFEKTRKYRDVAFGKKGRSLLRSHFRERRKSLSLYKRTYGEEGMGQKDWKPEKKDKYNLVERILKDEPVCP